MDYMLSDRCAKKRLSGCERVEGAAGGVSDHFLMKVSVKVGGGFRRGNYIRTTEVM